MASKPPSTGRELQPMEPEYGADTEDVYSIEDDTDEEEDAGLFPEDYESEEDFLLDVLEEYRLDYQADRHNIEEAMEDLRFIYVDQWDEKTRAEREADGRPCLTINTLPQYIGQVVGDRRINQTQIKVIPDKAGSKDVANVRSGLIRSIENYSRAETIYDQCCEDQVGCGISNYEITLEYSDNDVFEQDIFVRALANPFAVVWDRFHRNPTGKDAKRCYVEETLPVKAYERLFPDQPVPTTFDVEGVQGNGANFGEWVDGDDVKIVAYWRMIEKPAIFALMQDGGVKDVTDLSEEEYMDQVMEGPDGEPFIRESVRTYAQRWLITSFAVLEGPYELPLSRLPIIKVSGRVGRVGVKQYRFGLVRWARDPSLLRNYWRSVAAEHLAMAPKSQWIADYASVKGREDDFREAHLTGDPLLVYNTGKNAPKRVDPPQLQSALLNEANVNAQDIKDVTGIHDASLGIRSNEVSGKAIMARQREGDVATITYHDHLNQAIEEGGVVMNELIPIAYDTTRTIRTVGMDGNEEFVKINDALDEKSPDISMGKYDVKIITGPSYTTRRMEGAEMLLEMVKVNPALFEVAGDVIIEEQDFPGGSRIANRLKKVLPAAQQEEADKKAQEAEASGMPPEQAEPSPEEQMAQAAQQAQMEMAAAQLEAQKRLLEIEVADAEAKLQEQLAKTKIAQEQAEEAEAKSAAARANLVKVTAEADVAEHNAETHPEMRRIEIDQKANPPAPSGQSNQSGGAPRRAARPRSKRKTQ